MFNDIYKEINKLKEEHSAPPVDDVGVMPQPSSSASGTIVSLPGTERIMLSTSVADYITCEVASGRAGKPKMRYLVAHKDKSIKYAGQYCDSRGYPISIIPKDVFDTIITTINSMNKRMQSLNKDFEIAKIKAEALEMTINALRKNGVID